MGGFQSVLVCMGEQQGMRGPGTFGVGTWTVGGLWEGIAGSVFAGVGPG